MTSTVSVKKFIEKMDLKNMTPELNVDALKIKQPDINRPALQLAGYYEHFETSRVQIIGFVEYTYSMNLPDDIREERFENLLKANDTPCYVFCRDLEPSELFIKKAIEHNCAVLVSSAATSSFMAEAIRWLNVQLAPCISVHGVLVDVFGQGVLITGESGIGKSEAALELV
ncbi:MAG: HPr(Ser) kinase/phosphatase, partial [Lachnospiraceae bacterium]|nr:HPr(Ser) kinase/phosphatase [Lachnospiraceae bacterium]